MGNYAAIVTHYAWATRAFNYPQDVEQEDFLKAVGDVVKKGLKKR
jgi:hypothetical protein